eukprot:bmy_06873T0
MWWELMEGVGWLQVSSGGVWTPEGTPHLPGGARPDPARTCLCFLTSRSFQQARVIAIVQSGLTEELERAEQWPLVPLGLSSDRAQPFLASQFRFPDPRGHMTITLQSRDGQEPILGNTSSLWSSTPFSSSIWSSSLHSTLPFTSPANALPSIGLMGPESPSAPHTPSAASPADDLGQTYNPWRIWSPTIGRRSSDPWSNSHFPHEN